MYLYSSSTKPSSVIIGWVGTSYSKKGKARKCLQRAEQRVLLLWGLCVVDTGSVNRSPPSTTHIHGDTAITACEREITEMCCDCNSNDQLLLYTDETWGMFDVFL